MEYTHLKDAELTTLLRGGDALAYTELYERYHQILLKHAYRLLGDEAETFDVVQDVFLQLWQKRSDLTLHTSLSAYLYTAVKHRIFKLFAHGKVVDRYLDSLRVFMNATPHHTEIEQGLIEKELQSLIVNEINALPERMREVLLLNKQEELSYKEIADRLGTSDQTAKQQVYKAMKILKPKVERLLRSLLL